MEEDFYGYDYDDKLIHLHLNAHIIRLFPPPGGGA